MKIYKWYFFLFGLVVIAEFVLLKSWKGFKPYKYYMFAFNALLLGYGIFSGKFKPVQKNSS